ncbi:MAG: universal stress protein [Candidatus Rokubacteria bacterium]|nr:universal stress protein [Candidatus Rokubacteria bacterium]
MDRILVPLDGSALAEAIVAIIEPLAREHGAELFLLSAVPPGVTAAPQPPHAEALLVKGAETYLARLADGLRARGIAGVRATVRRAEPAQAISESAREHGADLIAMATHGRSGLGRLVVGSVAERVVREARVPVLLVRGEPRWDPARARKVLVPLDGSERSAAVLPVVERLAGPLDFQIVLLHVLEPIQPSAAAEIAPQLEAVERRRRTQAEEYLRDLATALEAKGIRAGLAVRAGSPTDAIRRHAQEEGFGLVAMATHGRTGLGRLLFGSIAEDVLRTVPQPLLLWKAPAPGP